MTVAAKPASASYVEDGASTSFPIPFRFKAPGDLVVERLLAVGGRQLLTLGTDYSVTGGATDAGGTLTRTVATIGARLRIRRRTTRAQPMVYATGDRFPAKSHEEAIDRGILISQEQDDDISDTALRAVLVPDGERGFELPPAAARRGRTLVVGSATNGTLDMLDGSLFKGDPGGNALAVGPAEALPLIAVDAGVNVVIVDGYTASADGGAGAWQVLPGEAPIDMVETRARKRTANNRVTRIPTDEPVSLSRFGVDQFAIRDQLPAIFDTFDVAAHEGYSLLGNPDARYRKDGPVLIQGVSFDGQGCVFQAMSDGPQAFISYPETVIVDRPFTLANFTTLGAAIARTSSNFDNGVTIGAIERAHMRNIILDNITVDSVEPGRGHGGAGIYLANVSRVRSYGCSVLNTFADGFHCTHGTQDAHFYSPVADRCGDDSFAVVSYRIYGVLCNDILFDRPLSVNGGSRGCATVGGRNIRYRDPTVRGSAGAAVYLFSEASFDTLGCDNVRVTGLTAEGCVVGGGAASGDPNFQNGVVMLGGREGTDIIDGAPFDRSVRDCHVDGIIRQAGSRAAQGAEYDNPFVIRPKIRLDMENVPLNIPGVLFGGEDGELQFSGRDLGGVPLVLSAKARGRHLVHNVKVDRARQANPAADTNILLTGAPNITELRVENAEFNQSSARAYNTDAGFPLDRLRTRGIKIDGIEATGTDYMQGTPVFASDWTGAAFALVKLADGFVAFNGVVADGTTANNTLIMQLPDGYWPRVTSRFAVPTAGGTTAIVEIRADGGVLLVSGGANGISLNLQYLAR
jgi:hypothetical protein